MDDKLRAIEDKVEELNNEIQEVKERMLTWGRLFWGVMFVLIIVGWGDKIWAFIKGIFWLLTGLGVKAIETTNMPEGVVLFLGMAFAIVVMVGIIPVLTYSWIVLQDKIRWRRYKCSSK